jgi:arginyl-tRNA synthetase
LREWAGAPAELSDADLSQLTSAYALALLRALSEFPEVAADAAEQCAPHLLAFYLRDLVAEFHSYYNAEKILVPDQALRIARVALAAATRQVLANGRSKVSAPEDAQGASVSTIAAAFMELITGYTFVP